MMFLSGKVSSVSKWMAYGMFLMFFCGFRAESWEFKSTYKIRTEYVLCTYIDPYIPVHAYKARTFPYKVRIFPYKSTYSIRTLPVHLTYPELTVFIHFQQVWYHFQNWLPENKHVLDVVVDFGLYILHMLLSIPSHSLFRSDFLGSPPIGFIVGLTPVMGKKQQPPVRTLPSKSHSCSEMEKGHKSLVAIKKEHQDPVELAAEIKAHKMFSLSTEWFQL